MNATVPPMRNRLDRVGRHRVRQIPLAIDEHVRIADHINLQVTRLGDRLHGFQRTGHGSAILCRGVAKTRPQFGAGTDKGRGSFRPHTTHQLDQQRELVSFQRPGVIAADQVQA